MGKASDITFIFVFIIITFIVAFFFSVHNITGLATSNFSSTAVSSSVFGIILFLAVLSSVVIVFRRRNAQTI